MIVRIYDLLLRWMAQAASVVLFVVMFGIGIDVGSRYMLGAPIGWVYELVQHCMLLMLFLGMGWVTRAREHVAVEILIDAVPPRPRRAMRVFANLASAATCLFIGYWSVLAAVDNMARGVMTDGIYPIPRGLLIGCIAVGLVFSAIEFLRLAAQVLQPGTKLPRSAEAGAGLGS